MDCPGVVEPVRSALREVEVKCAKSEGIDTRSEWLNRLLNFNAQNRPDPVPAPQFLNSYLEYVHVFIKLHVYT